MAKMHKCPSVGDLKFAAGCLEEFYCPPGNGVSALPQPPQETITHAESPHR